MFATPLKLARVTRDLPGLLRRPIGSDEARARLRSRLERRESAFLELLERAVYGYPASPYRRLLALSGCELGDAQRLVRQEGLEGALARLAEQGVYLTFDEFKGQRPAVRGSQTLIFHERDFDNPAVQPHLEASSGGTRGVGTWVKMSFPFLTDLAVQTRLAFDAHGLRQPSHLVWLQASTPNLIYAALGQRTLAWLVQVPRLPPRVRLACAYLAAWSRLLGRPLPPPRYHPVEAPGRLAERLLADARPARQVCVTTYASSAVRLCAEAGQRGGRLDGVTFITLGEPFTEAKRQIVAAAGARPLVRYAFTEAGIIGYACARPTESDDLHLFAEAFALIQRRRPIGDSGVAVEALLFSSLLPQAPKVLLNVESGDVARLERRVCGCVLGELGLDLHLSEVRSFEKLSSEGMTFMQTDLLRVLESVLPARFGGGSSDYQVLEEEAADGTLRLVLLVSPAVGQVDSEALCEAFLTELGRQATFDKHSAQVWRQAGTLHVRREPPIPTRAGKILPFHLQRAVRALAAESERRSD